MEKVTRTQMGYAIKKWVQKETEKRAYWFIALVSILIGLKFYTDETMCVLGIYGFYKLGSLVIIWFRNEYRYTMEKRRLFLKIMDKIEKRVAEDKPLW